MSKKRSRAREFAMQALYQWQLSASQLPDMLAQFAHEKNARQYESDYFQDLLRGVLSQVDTLDALIRPLVDRDIEQIDPVERAILRLAAYEFRQHPEIPYRVVINEAIELAKRYGAEQGHRYVNGVVDRLARELRAAEVNARRQGQG